MILICTTFIFSVLYAGLLLYYRIGWKDLTTFTRQGEKGRDVFISLVIPARDEESKLPALLNSLKSQTYPLDKFEILVVDDHSSDKTAAIVYAFPLANLKLIRLSDHIQDKINSYKKKAIEVGIAQSTGELILTTDADCITDPDWLKTLAAFYEKNSRPPMIIMPVLIESQKSLLGIFQALDFMTLQGVTGGAVQHGLHAMCNGANLAYTREAFNSVNGFKGIDALASGDDMLLMDKIQRHQPGSIRYLKSEDVIVRTDSMPTIGTFLNQRIRWASKTGQFKQPTILLSAVTVYLFNLLLAALFLSAVFDNSAHILVGISMTTLSASLLMLALKIIVEMFFLIPIARFFKQQSLLIYFPLIQPLHVLYTIVAGGLGMFGNYEWKGRKVK